MAAVPPRPATPILLYLGAGYDLSPLLTFSPNPPYQITTKTASALQQIPISPPRTTYTSFLFVDAKPRHTFAFTVSDFDQWKDVPSRVRNVIWYAQGMLNRWRVVDDDPDVIWFEGGGSSDHVASRHADSAWHFARPRASPPLSKSLPDHPPLVTLFYAFNTLDIELARMPSLANVLPAVTALYVHGLRPHPKTGLDHFMKNQESRSTPEVEVTPPYTRGLQHVYVIVGSWGTPRRSSMHRTGAQHGVRDVDFVKSARRRWRELETIKRTRKASYYPTTDLHFSSIDHDPDFDSDTDTSSPVVFHRPRPPWWDDSEEWGDYYIDEPAKEFPTPPSASTSPSELSWLLSSLPDSRFSTIHISPPGRRIRPSFYTRIPQIAWDDTLNGGDGGYYISKTVAESLAVWRKRGSGLLETESEDSTDKSDGEAEQTNIPERVEEHQPEIGGERVHFQLRPRSMQISPARYATSAPTTDVSDDESSARTRWPWFSRTASLSAAIHKREDPMDLKDFLNSSIPAASSSSVPYTASLCTHSCPDLKSTSPASRPLRALRSLAVVARNKRNNNASPRTSPSYSQMDPNTLSPKAKSTVLKKMGNYKELGRLIRRPGGLNRDSCESDTTRVA